jgi:hypothetical protein
MRIAAERRGRRINLKDIAAERERSTTELYASRRTGLVELMRGRHRPLCITPDEPERFIAAFLGHRVVGATPSPIAG